MVTETGQVISLQEGFAWVATQRKAVCDTCAAQKGCGSGVLAKVLGNRLTRVKVANSIGAEVGDEVVVGMDDALLVRTSFAVYAIPLIFMMAGALAGEMLGEALHWAYVDAATAIFGLGGLFGGFVWLRRYTRGIATDGRYQPRMLDFVRRDAPAEIAVAPGDIVRNVSRQRNDGIQKH